MNTFTKKMMPLLMAMIATFCFNYTSVAQNMVTNPGFENWEDGKPVGWIGEKTQPTIEIVQSSTAHDGSFSCQLINTGSTHNRFTSQSLSVESGQEYTVTFWLRGGGDVRTGFWDGQGSDGTNFAYNSYITATGTWTQHSQTVTAPVTATNAELIFSVRNTTGENILIDDVEMLKEGNVTLKANFKADKTTAEVGATINFTDLSTGNPTAWEWTVSGPETQTANVQNPSFTFTKAGSYDVTLIVSNDETSSEPETKADYIVIGDFILFQDFNSGDFGDWEIISITGDQQWIISSNGGPDGSPCAQMNGFSGGNNVNEDWLISPAFFATSFILTFENAKNFNGDDLKLFVSDDYSGDGDIAGATWTQLNFTTSTGNYNWVNSGEVKYTAQSNDDLHIAFKYTSTAADGALWRVDNIVLRNGSQNIAENPKTACKVYPNPSSTGIFIVSTEGNATIKALSIDGRLIKTQTMTQETTLDLSTCPQGIYFLQITQENGAVTTQKVVKN